MSEPNLTSWIRCSDDDESHRLAIQEAERTRGQILPGVAGIQSGRLQVATFVSIDTMRRLIAGMVPTGPARPSVPRHAAEIHDYLSANPQSFFLPTIAIGVLEGPLFYAAGDSTGSAGWLVIPRGAPFHIIDGHHRLLSLTGAKVGKSGRKPSSPPGLAEEALSLLVVFEDSSGELDQHFADASRALPLPTGQTVLLDLRDPINRIVHGVVDGSDFLRGRLEGSTTRLPPLSQYMYTAAAFRGMVVAYLDGAGWGSQTRLTAQFELEAASNLVASVSVLSREMAPWNEIAAAASQRVGGERMAALRADYFNMHAAGLSLIGKALASTTEKTPSGTASIASRVAHVDWRRGSEVWDGIRGVSEGGITRAKRDLADAWRRLEEILSSA